MLERIKEEFKFEVIDGKFSIQNTDYTWNHVELSKSEALELIGELYEMIEDMPEKEYNPLKDPKYIYQTNLTNQVYIEIKHEDDMLIKRIIRSVNKDPRLSELIGEKLG